jgi:hypothetical protein
MAIVRGALLIRGRIGQAVTLRHAGLAARTAAVTHQSEPARYQSSEPRHQGVLCLLLPMGGRVARPARPLHGAVDDQVAQEADERPIE